ncbi:TRAP transporter large permease [Marispirochaeta aestuarii]|uniref:TRAP transporter large permease n=1 Tax=Marispirochaeta aestuarii TaxID=1963862 RepID=UPI0029C784B2|nr:TRAP transporter large permease [Marispirochaeta aestuarii]
MGIIVISLFFLLFIVGFPVVLSILIPAIIYIFSNGITLNLISQRMHYALDSYPLIAVPVFIFVGNLMNSSGITRRIFKFADTLVGRLPGGLAQVNIFASLIFSGMSGAALADVGGLGQIEIKAMKERGFSASFAASVTCASATVGPIFPPSIPLVIYGSVAGVSVVKLLLAGITPAVLAIITLMIMTAVISVVRHYPRADRWPKPKEIVRDFLPAFPALLTPVLLILGMLSGLFTPTEAASVTAAYVLLISTVFYRELTWKHFVHASFETVKATSSILLIVAAASLFGWILAIEQIPQLFSETLLSITTNPYMLLLILNGILLIVGMFLDSTTATLLLVPIVVPPLVNAGIDPIHLGLVFIFNIMIGLVTPPMGLSLFLVSGIAKVTIRDIIREVLPYMVPLIVTLLLITYMPGFVLWIPNMLR